MQRREFLQNGLLLGTAAGLLPMDQLAEVAASPSSDDSTSIKGLVLPPLNASDRSALLYKLLRSAIRMENLELIKFALELGADVNGKTRYNGTPLYSAIWRESLDVVKFLVSQGADVNERDAFGRKPLCDAIETKSLDVVKFLVSQGADVKIDHDGSTPLHYAVRTTSLDMTQFFVSQGAEVNAVDYYGRTPLYESIFHLNSGDYSVELVEYLLSQGADVHIQDHHGRTALDCAKESLDESTNSEASERLRNIIDVLKKASGVDESSSETEAATESVPLSDDDTSMTELVLPPLNESDMSSLLFYLLRDAISIENIELTKFVLEQGADVNGASTSGGTPLHWAIWESSLDMVKFIVSQGADIHAIGNYGRTPLHLAVWKGSIEMAEFLISQGADVNAMEGKGKTPLDLAKEKGNMLVVEYLESVIARNDTSEP